MGYPLNALNALRHVSSSWLSREIIFASLYLAALGLATLLMFAKKSGWKLLLAAAGLVGLVDVFCMAQIYMHASVVTWSSILTGCWRLPGLILCFVDAVKRHGRLNFYPSTRLISPAVR